jgi:hypothetical protein
MSNVFPPKLQPDIPPLPKINNIIPLNLRSISFEIFPPLKTPKIMSEKREIITYPALIRNKLIEKTTEYMQYVKKNKFINYFIYFIIGIIILYFLFRSK